MQTLILLHFYKIAIYVEHFDDIQHHTLFTAHNVGIQLCPECIISRMNMNKKQKTGVI